MVLMCSTLRKRRADQSSSMATIRTGSNPAAANTGHPESRLKPHLYRLELPLGYAIHRTPSPSDDAASALLATSSSAWVTTKAIVKEHLSEAERLTATFCREASSGSNDAGALSTCMAACEPRFRFLKRGDMLLNHLVRS